MKNRIASISKLPVVAYFCMEFGLHEDFKIYSGGLGILAGDILKAARDEKLHENFDSLISGQLYAWFSEERIAQEMVLGIGGIRALRALGIQVDLYHFNDNHPVIAGMELIREKMDLQGLSFEEAWAETRKRVVFTTHTPVPEGNELHEHELLQYMGANNGLTYGQMLKLGGDPVNGWQIGDGYEGEDQDEVDLESLYRVLQEEIIPTYQNRAKWEEMTGASIEMAEWNFSAARMLREYYEKLYC